MLKINEIFGPTIQGEGKSVGKEVTFLRTALCNLYCKWCDTPYTWNWEGTDFVHEDSKKYSKAIEIHEMDIHQIIKAIMEIGCTNIVISGGEPLIQHKQLTSVIEQLKKLDNYWIEVETNGTIYPNERFLELVDQINCSPKFENSGNTRSDREKKNVLTKLAANSKVNFKFVISSEKDVEEVLYYTETYKMKEVYLMPLGVNVEQLKLTTELTQKLCADHGFIFSDRLHITLLGGGRGV